MKKDTRVILSELINPWAVLSQQNNKAKYKIRITIDDIEYLLLDFTDQSKLQSNSALSPIGSVSKIITAIAIGVLHEQNKLSLKDNASAYLPWLLDIEDDLYHMITIEQLLSHTAGLTRDGYSPSFWLYPDKFPSAEQLKKIIQDNPLTYRPGYTFKYSNLGFALLGQIIESITNMTYENFVIKYIFEPLELEEIHANSNELPLPMTEIYNPMKRQVEIVPVAVDTKAYLAATGWCASLGDTHDLINKVFIKSEVLQRETIDKLMDGNQRYWDPFANSKTKYGFGMLNIADMNSQYYGHVGSFYECNAAVFFDLNKKLIVTALSTNSTTTMAEIGIASVDFCQFLIDNISLEAGEKPYGMFANRRDSKMLIPTKDGRIISITPNTLWPFEDYETFVPTADEGTFTITSENDLLSNGEVMKVVDHSTIEYVGIRYEKL